MVIENIFDMLWPKHFSKTDDSPGVIFHTDI